jgi:hypothetical protein
MQPAPVKRGRPLSRTPDTSRLGPELRKLLIDQGEQPPHAPAPPPPPPPAAAAPRHDGAAGWPPLTASERTASTRELRAIPLPGVARGGSFESIVPQVLAQLAGNRHAQAMLIRQYLSIARRANDSEAMGNGLLIAAQLDLDVDEVIRFDKLPDAAEGQTEAMPAFLKEWFESERPCLSRHVCDGCMYFLTNRALRASRLLGDGMRDGPMGVHEFQELPLTRAITVVAENRLILTKMLTAMLQEAGSASAGGAPRAAMHHCAAVGEAPVLVTGADGAHGLYRLAARLCSKELGAWVWTCLWFDPVGPADATAAPAAGSQFSDVASDETAAASTPAQSSSAGAEGEVKAEPDAVALLPKRARVEITDVDVDSLLDCEQLGDDDAAILNSLLDIGLDLTQFGSLPMINAAVQP